MISALIPKNYSSSSRKFIFTDTDCRRKECSHSKINSRQSKHQDTNKPERSTTYSRDDALPEQILDQVCENNGTANNTFEKRGPIQIGRNTSSSPWQRKNCAMPKYCHITSVKYVQDINQHLPSYRSCSLICQQDHGKKTGADIFE